MRTVLHLLKVECVQQGTLNFQQAFVTDIVAPLGIHRTILNAQFAFTIKQLNYCAISLVLIVFSMITSPVV